MRRRLVTKSNNRPIRPRHKRCSLRTSTLIKCPVRALANVLVEAVMRRLTLGANFVVFLLFFGIALLEALQARNWIKAAFWLAIGTVFLLADTFKKAKRA